MHGGINTTKDSDFKALNVLVNKLVRSLVPKDDISMIDQYVPDREQPYEMGNTIKWDEEIFDWGQLVPLADPNAQAPLVRGEAGRTREVKPLDYRVRHIVNNTDYFWRRRPGTNEPMVLSDQVTKWTKRLREMIDYRRVWLKWMAIASSTSFSVYGQQLIQELDYTSNGLHTTVATNWDVVGATPIDDIIDFLSMFRTYGVQPRTAFYGTNILNALMSNSDIRTIIMQQIYRRVNDTGIFNTVGPEGLNALLRNLFGDLEFVYYPNGIQLVLKTTKTVTGVNAIPVVGNVELFAADDVVNVEMADGTVFTATLSDADVEGGWIESATFAGYTIPAGTLIRKKLELTMDKFIVLPEPSVMRDKAELVMVASPNSSISNPQSGVYARMINHENHDPAFVELIAGFSGTVVMAGATGLYLSANVLS